MMHTQRTTGIKQVIKINKMTRFSCTKHGRARATKGDKWPLTSAREITREWWELQPSLQTDFPGGSESKASAYSAGDPGSILGLGRSSGEGNGNALQYSCLENPMDRGAW